MRSPRALFLALVVVVDLVQHAAFVGPERAVIGTRRPARIGRRLERLTAFALVVVADDEIALEQVNLLPVIVHERRGGVDAGLETQQPRSAAHLVLLVEIA